MVKTFKSMQDVRDTYTIVKTKDQFGAYMQSHRPNYDKIYLSLTAFLTENAAPVSWIDEAGWHASVGLVGVQLRGRVEKVTRNRLLLRFEDGLVGRLDRADFAWGREREPLSRFCHVGDELTVVVLDDRGSSLYIGRKHRFSDPWSAIKFKPGDRIQIRIQELSRRAIKVTVDEPSVLTEDALACVVGEIRVPRSSPPPLLSNLRMGQTLQATVKRLDLAERVLLLDSDEIFAEPDRRSVDG